MNYKHHITDDNSRLNNQSMNSIENSLEINRLKCDNDSLNQDTNQLFSNKT